MPPADTSRDFVLPSEQRLRDVETTLMFGRRTVRTVYAVAMAAGLLLFARGRWHQTALLAPIDPNFHAAMIGLGAFVGVLLAAVEYDGWQLGIGRVNGGMPKGIWALVCMLALVGLSGVAGHFVAGQLVEWRAFHGLNPPASDVAFTVVSRDGTRSGDWLELAPAAGGDPVSIGCGGDVYSAVSVGDRLILPVQTGRGGVRRVTLPPLAALKAAAARG